MSSLILTLTNRSVKNMTPRSSHQFKEIRENRKAQIMETALRLFSIEGYAHCTISMIAREAGISKGLLYNYFESKEVLLNEILEQGLNEIWELFDINKDGDLTTEELEYFIRTTFKLMRKKRDYWIIYFGLLMQPRVMEQVVRRPSVKNMESYFGILLNYFEKRGFENPLLEVTVLSALIEGMGILMIYTRSVAEMPNELLDQFEERVIMQIKNRQNQ